MDFPRKINLGSGKDFRKDCLNIDIEARWNPDIIWDLSLPILEGDFHIFETKRFGNVKFEKSIFDEIIAYDVLEHVGNLTICMRSCLDLLRLDGFIDIVVPYDLSLGAWQDPTHVRAFNQNSWIYYCKWYWYLGWTREKFFLNKIEFKLSSLGLDLKQNGMDLQQIVDIPRATDGMKVELRKVVFDPEEK